MTPELLVLTAAAFAWNFLTIGAYSMVGPARGALIMTHFGPAFLPWVYMGSAALTGLVVWLYERTARAPRRPLIAGWLAFLAVTMGGGAWLVAATHWRALEYFYFLWSDVFGIMSVTLFWTYANDLFGPADAPRVFGVLAAGAPLGAVAGAFLDERLIGRLGPVAMLGLSALVFAGTVPLFLLLESRGRARGLSGAPPEAAAPPPTRGVLRAIAASPYLVFLTLTVALERMVPDFGYYAFGTAASRAFGTDGRAMGAFFASVNLWTNVASFALSALAAAPLLRWAGVGACLASSGLANLGLFVTFPFVPTLGVASFFYGADGATRYSLFKTAKETTYSSTDKEVVYRVKAFVEMFVYRFARGAAGFLLLAAGWLGGEERGALILGGLMALLWIYASLRVGREHAGLQRSAARPRRPLNA